MLPTLPFTGWTGEHPNTRVSGCLLTACRYIKGCTAVVGNRTILWGKSKMQRYAPAFFEHHQPEVKAPVPFRRVRVRHVWSRVPRAARRGLRLRVARLSTPVGFYNAFSPRNSRAIDDLGSHERFRRDVLSVLVQPAAARAVAACSRRPTGGGHGVVGFGSTATVWLFSTKSQKA